MKSNVYFETQVGAALDQLLPVFPVASFLYLLFKSPKLANHFSGLLNTSSDKVRLGTILLSSLLIFHSIFSYFEVKHLHAVIEEKHYEVVTGCVEDYKSHISATKYRTESFVINKAKFEFSNFTQSRYFSGSDHIDNFIANGNCMEISYITDGHENKILKIVSLPR